MDAHWLTITFHLQGYKEFDPYFSAIEQDTHGEKELDKIRNECTERMKSATRRYAKRQVQWIRNKLLPIVAKSKDVDIYLLDATGKRQIGWDDVMKALADRRVDLDSWETNVRLPAIQVAEGNKYLGGSRQTRMILMIHA